VVLQRVRRSLDVEIQSTSRRATGVASNGHILSVFYAEYVRCMIKYHSFSNFFNSKAIFNYQFKNLPLVQSQYKVQCIVNKSRFVPTPLFFSRGGSI
jgi:hypothetical protein